MARHAAGKRIALEIGTDEGVSAVRIAHAMGGACCTVSILGSISGGELILRA